MNTIAKLFDPRGGHSVISDRCEVCNDPLHGRASSICEACEREEEEFFEGEE